ncbi:hypothetical protein [Bacillus sp. Hm123]|uniref:hypothetical protein n=1 Tax=Bacillus sp. Hm123 TaxID=3450745 RepID=UPI003F4323E7
MNNLQRLELEVSGTKLSQNELSVYLQENGLNPTDEYDPSSDANKRAIYGAALSILESIANNPNNLRSLKLDDMTISDFADSIMARIDQLDRKIRLLKKDEQQASQSQVFILFE